MQAIFDRSQADSDQRVLALEARLRSVGCIQSLNPHSPLLSFLALIPPLTRRCGVMGELADRERVECDNRLQREREQVHPPLTETSREGVQMKPLVIGWGVNCSFVFRERKQRLLLKNVWGVCLKVNAIKLFLVLQS